MAVSLCVEGLEYNGKSSLSALVAKTLSDTTVFPVIRHREPGGTLLGEHIRQTLKTDEFKGMHPVTSLLLLLCKEFQERVVVIDGFSEFWEIVLALRNLALERMSQNPEYAVIAKAAIKDFTLVDLNKYVQTNLGSLGSDLQRQVVKQEETRRRLGAEDKQVLRRRMLDEWCQLGIQGMSF